MAFPSLDNYDEPESIRLSLTKAFKALETTTTKADNKTEDIMFNIIVHLDEFFQEFCVLRLGPQRFQSR